MSISSFGSRSTAEQVARDIKLKGKTFIVTGSNCGIGKETARVLAKMGANVYLACRNAEEALKVVEEIKKNTGNENIHFMKLDLGDLESVRNFAKEWQSKNIQIDCLINNAGVMAIPSRKTTKDGFEMTFGINHLGHFLLTNLLLPYLANGSRVINLSGGVHRISPGGVINFDDLMMEKSYSRLRSYGQSKLANILFSQELDKRMKEQKKQITSYSLHPGAIRTNLTRHFTGGWYILELLVDWTVGWFGKSIPQGAATTILVATAPEITAEKDGGSYWSDCQKSPVQAKGGIEPLASEQGKKLWEISEKLVGLTTK